VKLRHAFKNVGLAAAMLGLGTGLTISATGCGAGPDTKMGAPATETSQAAIRPVLPALDLEAPASFQTATFAYG
jgi:hypothetical protein